MLEIMEKQFQCYEVQRRGMKTLRVTQHTACKASHLLEARAAFSVILKGHHSAEWKGRVRRATSAQRERAKAGATSRVPTSSRQSNRQCLTATILRGYFPKLLKQIKFLWFGISPKPLSELSAPKPITRPGGKRNICL